MKKKQNEINTTRYVSRVLGIHPKINAFLIWNPGSHATNRSDYPNHGCFETLEPRTECRNGSDRIVKIR